MIFINTRPTPRAQPLSEFLQHRGISVVDLPLLELVAMPLNNASRQALGQLCQVKVVILVSEEAVYYGLKTLSSLTNLATVATFPITWLAVGQKTAACFASTWQQLSTSLAPQVIFPQDKRQQNNEGMLAMPVIRALAQGDAVQLWRGVGGRALLAETLALRGVEVRLINLYQRSLPHDTRQQFCQWQPPTHSPCVVLISSLAAWQHWQQLVAASSQLLSSYEYLVLQQRVASLIHQQFAALGVTVIDDLQPRTIYHALLALGSKQ